MKFILKALKGFVSSGVSIFAAASVSAWSDDGGQSTSDSLLKLVNERVVERVRGEDNLFQLREGVLENLVQPLRGDEDAAAETIQLLNEAFGENVTVTRREKFEIRLATQDNVPTSKPGVE